MKARVIATGEIWEFSQIDEITFKCASNGRLYCAEELEFLEPSVFTPDYWTRLEHQYAGMAMQGLLTNSSLIKTLRDENVTVKERTHIFSEWAKMYAHALVKKMKEERE